MLAATVSLIRSTESLSFQHPVMEFDQSLYVIVIKAFLNMDTVLHIHVFQQNPGLWAQTDGVLQNYPVQNRIQVHINNGKLSRF